MKLSTLLGAISPIRGGAHKAERRAQPPEGIGKARHAPRAANLAYQSDPEIGSIHYRAQEVLPGGMFVALKGRKADGHDFVDQAFERGAAAVVVQKTDRLDLKATAAGTTRDDAAVVQVPDTRKALADLAARFYGNPSHHMALIGITGTNGKTTVSYLIESVLAKAGFEVGVIGTINYRYAGKTFNNTMTTPESLDLQRILADMLRAGVTAVVMEASSHAMDLYRIRGCAFDVGVFTNLSQDHLDFHGNMTSYWSSKKRFFTEYLKAGPKKQKAVAVINCDDPKGRELTRVFSGKTIKTGSLPTCDVRIETSRYDLNGTAGKVATSGGSFEFKTPLVGIHNVENILSTAGAAVAFQIEPAAIKAGIEAIAAIPGRLERIANDGGRFVYVDYAHTPAALENAVSALKQMAPARIICVFGCGGDRDKKKRPLMGAVVARLSDLAIVTSDNPRTEDPVMIIDQILPGIRRVNPVAYSSRDLDAGFVGKGYVVEPDRRQAIELGIRVSRPGDVVIIAGKGHETYQVLGSTTIDFDDREEARKALAGLEA